MKAGTTALFEALAQLARDGVSAAERDRLIVERFGRVRAILVADSAGFTRTAAAYGVVHYLAMLAEVRRSVGEVFLRHGCLRVRTEADNLFGEFDHPEMALAAALEANRTVAQSGLMLSDDEGFSLCMGIGYGEVLDGGHEGLYGAEMNLVSKLGEDTADPWEILLTDAAFHALPTETQRGFERRVIGLSGHDTPYYWMHDKP